MDHPHISIIVPVYNDPDGVDATLSSLSSQTTAHPHEIAVVDNNSTDRTPDVVRTYQQTHDHIHLYQETEIQSSYAARNKGIKHTNADLLAFLDADMTVPESWIDDALNMAENTDGNYVGCNVELTLPKEPSLAAQYDHHTGFPVKQYISQQHFVPTCCLLVSRQVVEDIGPFDHRLVSGGDKEFGNRVYNAGYDLHFAEDVTVYHPTRNSIHDHIKKDLRVGKGLCQLQHHYPDRYGSPGIPPRPSGIKRPRRTLSIYNRLTFEIVSTFLTGVRAFGYYREYLRSTNYDDIESANPV